MAIEVIIKVLDDEELKLQFSQDGNVYKATLPNPYENMGELIRCKDCRYFEREYDQRFRLEEIYRIHNYCAYWKSITDENGYCFMGEKRKEE